MDYAALANARFVTHDSLQAHGKPSGNFVPTQSVSNQNQYFPLSVCQGLLLTTFMPILRAYEQGIPATLREHAE